MDKREFLKTLVTASVAAPIAAATSVLTRPGPATEKKSVYQRMMSKGVLRAGWFEEPPFTYYEPNTGARRGIAVKLAEQILGSVNIKIDWVSITNFANMAEDMAIGHYDAICASLIMLPRGGRIDYTMPYAYVPMHGYVRTGEARFGPDLTQINNPAYKIAGIDSEGGTTIAHQKFPRAQFLDLPQGTQISELLLNVVNNKADVAFVMPTVFAEFDRHNPGVLKPIASEEPLHIFAVAFGLCPEEEALKSLFNNNLQRMIVSGEMEALFKEFDPSHYLLRPSIRYAQQER